MSGKKGSKHPIGGRGHWQRSLTMDECDLHFMADYNWSDNGNGYLRGQVDGKTVYLHRLIMGAKPGQIVDHVNQDSYDVRRDNLRFVNKSENALNNKRRASVQEWVRGTCRVGHQENR